MLNLAPSSHYYKVKEPSVPEQKTDADIRDRIEQIACEFIHYTIAELLHSSDEKDILLITRKS